MCKNIYTYNIDPKYKTIDNIPSDKCIKIVFNENHPNMVIEYLTEISDHLIREEALNQFFKDLDIAKNAINIVNAIKTFGDVNYGDHIIVIDHADRVFTSYISSPSKSWRRDILKQWDDFLNYITVVSGKNKMNIGIVLFSDIPIEYSFIRSKYQHHSIYNKVYSDFIEGICKRNIKTETYENYKNFEQDIDYIRNIYEMYSNLDQNNEEEYCNLLNALCKTESVNYLFSDRGFLFQEYGYNKLLLEIIKAIEKKNPA